MRWRISFCLGAPSHELARLLGTGVKEDRLRPWTCMLIVALQLDDPLSTSQNFTQLYCRYLSYCNLPFYFFYSSPFALTALPRRALAFTHWRRVRLSQAWRLSRLSIWPGTTMLGLGRKKDPEASEAVAAESEAQRLDHAQSFWVAILPVFACGAGLFSDGYINNVSMRSRVISILSSRHVLT